MADMGLLSFLTLRRAQRISIVSVALVPLLSSISVPARSDPSVTVRREALAEWSQPNKTDARLMYAGKSQKVDFWNYEVWVRRRTPGPALVPVTVVRLSRYACVWEEDNGAFCDFLYQEDQIIPNNNFQFDDTLETASVTFRALGKKHSATWKGVSNRGRGIADGDCGSSPIGTRGEGLNRWATASGKVFGKRLRHSDSESVTSLAIMAYVQTCSRIEEAIPLANSGLLAWPESSRQVDQSAS